MASQRHRFPGVILAAGAGRRFSQGNKLLLPLRGGTIIGHVVTSMLESQIDPVLLVTGSQAEAVREALGGFTENLRIVHNERWQTGQASSIRTALAHLPPGAAGALILPGDMPLMTPSLIDRVAQRCVETEKICFPVRDGEKGHPTAFPAALLSLLAQIEGDTGGLNIVRHYWNEAEKIELSDDEAMTQLDVDTDADYRRLEHRTEVR